MKAIKIKEIENSFLYSDFIKYKKLPSIDKLLDWRIKVKKEQKTDKYSPKNWYKREIKAVDYLLKLHVKNGNNQSR